MIRLEQGRIARFSTASGGGKKFHRTTVRAGRAVFESLAERVGFEPTDPF